MADAAPGQLTRQQLYDRIRETSKDEYILSEMKRLGFWQSEDGKPQLSEELINRKGELSRELQKLLKDQRLYSDPERALKEFRKQRMKEAKEKREETKRRHAEERHQRALKWFERQQNEITYAGEDVSIGIQNKQLDMARLRQQGLPVIHNSLSFANAMGVTLNELRFLSFNRKTSKVNHYRRFYIAKKTGGERLISAPMPRLKRAQYWILDNILGKLEVEDCAHGFVPGKSIVTNAEPHVGKDVVINLDLKDFFPTISYKRIKGLFIKLGYSEEVSIIMALICSEPDIEQYELDGEVWNIAKSQRYMPQGAPTSPTISNLICRKLDKRLKGLAAKFGYTYTRYADDLTFSASGNAANDATKLLAVVSEIVNNEGFTVHPEKTRIMRKGRHQEVTGITVNEKLSIDRKTLKKFRALLFQIEKDGPQDKNWGTGNLFSSIQGYANFVTMVSPEKGQPLKKRVAAIIEQHGSPSKHHREEGLLSGKRFRQLSAEGQAPRQNWWQATPDETSPQIEKTDQQIKEERQAAYEEKKKQEKEPTQPAPVTPPVTYHSVSADQQERPAQQNNVNTANTAELTHDLEKTEKQALFYIGLALAGLLLAIMLRLFG